jgi:hypothetical protein
MLAALVAAALARGLLFVLPPLPRLSRSASRWPRSALVYFGVATCSAWRRSAPPWRGSPAGSASACADACALRPVASAPRSRDAGRGRSMTAGCTAGRGVRVPRQDIEAKLSSLPAAPGVYFFKDAAGEILYIGKANSLRAGCAAISPWTPPHR